VFAQVTARETGRHMASRALWLLGSTGLQGGLVAAVVAASLLVPPAVTTPIGPTVILPPPRPAPRPAPRPPQPTGQARTTQAPPPPSALVQPQAVAAVAPVAPGPPDPVAGDASPADGEWVPGTQPTGATSGGEEEILHVQAGFRAPAMAARGCVQQSLRVPRELSGFVSGQVVVKFAVGRDGAPSRFSVVGSVPDRLAGAIWQAVQDCRWIAGADPSGQPVSIWVVMPLRFSN
jgi:periplasmic protein TonB